MSRRADGTDAAGGEQREEPDVGPGVDEGVPGPQVRANDLRTRGLVGTLGDCTTDEQVVPVDQHLEAVDPDGLLVDRSAVVVGAGVGRAALRLELVAGEKVLGEDVQRQLAPSRQAEVVVPTVVVWAPQEEQPVRVKNVEGTGCGRSSYGSQQP